MAQRYKILLIDDDEDTLSLTKTYLKNIDDNIEIICVCNGEDALNILKASEYDCIITDYFMNNMNGIEFNTFKSEICDTPCILYTGKGSEEVAELAFQSGFEDYIRKEVNISHYTLLYNRIIKTIQKKQLEKQFIKTQSQIEVDKIQNNFISSATHELRTPIAALKSLFEILYEEDKIKQDDNLFEIITLCNKNINRINRLTDNILNCFKYENNYYKLNKDNFDYEKTIKNVIYELKPLILNKNMMIEIEFKTNHTIVRADKEKIEQVIVNMISNAIKYAPNNSRIYVTTLKEKNNIITKIRDEGIGLSKTDIEKIFLPFPNIKKDAYYEGTGLGLSICKKIIELHRGNIWVESKGIDCGSTFSFSIPVEVV